MGGSQLVTLALGGYHPESELRDSRGTHTTEPRAAPQQGAETGERFQVSWNLPLTPMSFV